MSKIDVRIVRLDALKVAAAHGFGPSPEGVAWEKLLYWMKDRGLTHNQVRFFGFNNPNPSPGSPNYGYEQWVTVPDGTPAGPEIKIQDFAGGLYAVMRCKLPEIGTAWNGLSAWREDSPYKSGQHQWLEECLTPPGTPFEEVVMDIYLPIAE
jgi:DNA gyrase inhibitor GyrI